MLKVIQKYKIQIGIILAILFLYLALRKISWIELGSIFSGTSFILITFVIALNLAIRLVVVSRWRLLLLYEKNISLGQVFQYMNIGYFINTLFPARAGDFIKAVMVAQKNNISKTSCLASVALERLFDMVGLGMVFIAAFILLDLPDYIKKGGVIILTLAIIVLVTLFILSKHSKTFYTYFSFLNQSQKYLWILRRFELLLSYSYILRIRKVFFGVLSATVITWFLYVFIGYIIIEKIAPGPFSWQVSIVALLIVGVSFVLPSTPGNLGVYQYASVLAFSIFGMLKEPAIVFSLISQIIELLVNILLGAFSMWHLGITGKELKNQETDTGKEFA